MNGDALFRDRQEAGERLADLLRDQLSPERVHDAVVLGLPRGGVPVAAQVAGRLDLELEVFVVRKIGVPGHEEVAMGAVASGGAVVRTESVIDDLSITEETFDVALDLARAQVDASEDALGQTAISPRVASRTAIVVDDGAATGSTMRVAIAGLRKLDPAAIIVALPIALGDSAIALGQLVDDLYCVHESPLLRSVGAAYADFAQTTDDDVRQLMQAARDRMSRGGG